MKQRLISYAYIFHNSDAFFYSNDKLDQADCGISAKESIATF